MDDIKAVAQEAQAQSNSIASGSIKFYRNGAYYEQEINADLMYEFGTDENGEVMHYTNTTDYMGTVFDAYVMKDDTGAIIPVQWDMYSENYDLSITEFTEINYPFTYLVGYSYGDSFGIENLVLKLHGSAVENVNLDLTYGYEDGTYSFEFGYWYLDTWSSVPQNYYEISVSFSVAEDKHMDHAIVSVTTYESESFIIDDELGTISVLDDATVSEIRSYDISQVAGPRDYVSTLSLSSFYATSFDLSYDGEKITEDTLIEINKGDNIKLAIENVLPSTANFSFDDVTIEVVDGDEDGISGSLSTWFGTNLSVFGEKVGTYTVKVSSKNVSYTFTIKVNAVGPKSVSVSYSTKKPGGGYNADVVNEGVINGFVGVEYVIQASIMPYNAEQAVTATCTSDNASDCNIEVKTFGLSEYAEIKDWNCFTASAPGDYTVRVASSVAENVYVDITFHIVEAPTFKQLFENDYAYCSYNGLEYKFEFIASNNEGTEGTAILTDVKNAKTESVTYVITKEESEYNIAFTHVSGDELNIVLKASLSYDLYMYKASMWGDGGSYEQLVEYDLKLALLGTWTVTDENNICIEIYFQANGSATLNITNYSNYQSIVIAMGTYDLAIGDESFIGTFTATNLYTGTLVSETITFEVDLDFSTITISVAVDEATVYTGVLEVAQW